MNKVIRDLASLLAPEFFEPQKLSDSAQMRQLKMVMRLAISGLPKPSRFIDQAQWDMINHFYAATNRKSPVYNQSFDILVRKIRPDWFLPCHVRKVLERKTHIVEDATLGFPRPIPAYEIEAKYGKAFCAVLKEIRPEWFVTPQEAKARKSWVRRKMVILKKVRQGLRITHAERQFLYLCRTKTRLQYDPEFVKIVEKYRKTFVRRAELRHVSQV